MPSGMPTPESASFERMPGSSRTHPSSARQWLYGSLALVGLVGAIALSVLSGNPTRLPGAALGSPALLYVEKTAACFTAYLLALVVVVRAFDGDLPSELRGLKYDVRESSRAAAQAIADLTAEQADLKERLDDVEALLDVELTE